MGNQLIIQKSIVQPIGMNLNRPEITVAIASLSIGGAEKIVIDWARRIHLLWNVHLIVLRTRPHEWQVPSFVKVTRLEPNNIVPQLNIIAAQLVVQGQKIITCHLLKKQERDALSQAGLQVVNVLHNARTGWSEDESNLGFDSNLIAVSQACVDDLRYVEYDGPVSIIRHIPSKPVCDPNIRSKFRGKYHLPQNAKIIGMIGAVKSQKNYEFACCVLRKILEIQADKNIYLVIVGGPVNTKEGKTCWESLIQTIEFLGVKNRVCLTGFLESASQYLPAFDLILNTSHYEGLSIATLEALLCGLPVVASKVGGQGEIMSEGLILIDSHDSSTYWSETVMKNLCKIYPQPQWSKYASHRLWTLAGIAYDFLPETEKILFVTANLNSGGAQRSLVNLTKQINSKINLEIVCTDINSDDYFYQNLCDAGVTVTQSQVDRWDEFAHAENLVLKICSEKIGTVCFWNVAASIKLLLVKALAHTNVKFVDVSPGDYIYSELETTKEKQAIIGFSTDDYFARINSFVLKYHGSFPQSYQNKKYVIVNGVPIPKNVKSDYQIHKIPTVVMSGRISETKFNLEVMKAMEIVWEKYPTAQLHTYGGAEVYKSDYAALVYETVKNEINKRVFFHGVDFEAVEKLAQYDIFVVLGKNQGCPNALLEALSVGMPCIGNNDGGTAEQIINSQTGLLIEECDLQELSQSIIRLIEDRSLAQRLGKNGRNHILSNFSMEKMGIGYEQLFKQIKQKQITYENYSKVV